MDFVFLPTGAARVKAIKANAKMKDNFMFSLLILKLLIEWKSSPLNGCCLFDVATETERDCFNAVDTFKRRTDESAQVEMNERMTNELRRSTRWVIYDSVSLWRAGMAQNAIGSFQTISFGDDDAHPCIHTVLRKNHWRSFHFREKGRNSNDF